MSLLRVIDDSGLVAPTMVAAFDAWVDAGSASTLAVGALIDSDAPVVAELDADQLFDYRARRPTLDIIDGRPARLAWPTLVIRRTRLGERDLLVLTGPEPDFRWRELADDVVAFARSVELEQWISIGAIPAAVPHTRPVPILGTESSPGLLRGDVVAGPRGRLRVPSAALSMLDIGIAEAGIPALGYFAQIPHYVSGEYAPAAVALLEAVTGHLGVRVEAVSLRAEAEQLRTRLNTATSLDEKTRSYVTRLEEMVDESGLPAGDELISEIERFLREQGNEPGHGQVH
ncbi:MAG TPA: PAC2 family protein, partial [Candidatus Limnocylindrales bacterium]